MWLHCKTSYHFWFLLGKKKQKQVELQLQWVWIKVIHPRKINETSFGQKFINRPMHFIYLHPTSSPFFKMALHSAKQIKHIYTKHNQHHGGKCSGTHQQRQKLQSTSDSTITTATLNYLTPGQQVGFLLIRYWILWWTVSVFYHKQCS